MRASLPCKIELFGQKYQGTVVEIVNNKVSKSGDAIVAVYHTRVRKHPEWDVHRATYFRVPLENLKSI